jgi:transcriptional regulator with XRE-family HTH domain
MVDDVILAHQRNLQDYRLALGLALSDIRKSGELTMSEAAHRSGIPEQTLRSYERGTHQPQLQRLTMLAQVLGMSLFGVLLTASEYVCRASGRPHPDPGQQSDDGWIRLYVLLLYCGVSPDEVEAMVAADPSWRRSSQ